LSDYFSASDADDLRLGRAAILDLLASLLLRELDLPTARLLAADPMLADALQPPTNEQGLQALRARYASLFLIDLPPYAALYLDLPATIGGETCLRWERLLAEQGQPLASLERAAAPDHAGLYLRALATAERRGSVSPILCDALCWLPQYLTALARDDANGFYGRLAELVGSALEECAAATPCPPSLPPHRKPDADPEDDSIRALAAWLTMPAQSGWYLSKATLRRLAQPFGVALGMTDRAHMLEAAFEASALDERTPELLDALLAELATWQDVCGRWRGSLGEWAGVPALWQAHLINARWVLTTMRSALRRDDTHGSPTE
jgi:TorA maturation chaperone TorD